MQLRLLLMVSALILVLVLMREARDPRNWAWLWLGQQRGAPGAASSRDSLHTRPPAPVRAADGEPGPARASPPALGAVGEGNRETRAPADAGSLLQRHGIDAGQLGNLVDGQPPGPREEETLLQILYRLPRIPLEALHRRRNDSGDWSQLLARPAEHRGEVWLVAGRAKRVERITVPAEAAERVEFAHYFRVTVELDARPHQAAICTREVPQAWPVGEPLDERCEALGFFLKLGRPLAGGMQLVLAAPRAMWFPDRADPARGIGPDQLYLARCGLDIGLFDAVRSRNGKSLGLADRECFYQLLAAVGRAAEDSFRRHARRPLDLAGLLRDPASQHGRMMTVHGTVRRVVSISVGEKDIRERFGIGRYYQVDVFVPLGDLVVRIGEPPPGKDAPTFTASFPVTVCALDLPAGLQEGENLSQDVVIPSVFFKVWAFRSEYMSAFEDGRRQPSPMFVARLPQVVGEAQARRSRGAVAAGFILLAVLAGFSYGIWKWERRDERLRRKWFLRRSAAIPSEQPVRSDSDAAGPAERPGLRP